jgi:hypothetical protein
MSGIQFSSPVTNQKASPAVYASSLATRPAPQLPGRIFVDTDNPSTGMYRDTGTAWVQLSSGSGTVPDLQTVCNVGFLTDTDMTFLYTNSADTSKIGFLNQAVGDFTFDIFKKANELFAIRALKPSTVDEEMELIFDAPGNEIRTEYNSQEQGFKFDFLNLTFSFGNNYGADGCLIIDANNQESFLFNRNLYLGSNNNGTFLLINDFNPAILTTYGGNDTGLKLDFSNDNYLFGNYIGNDAGRLCININIGECAITDVYFGHPYFSVANASTDVNFPDLTIDGSNNIIKTQCNSVGTGFLLDFDTLQYQFGDTSGNTGGMNLVVDNTNRIITIGDTENLANSTTIIVNDNSGLIKTQYGNLDFGLKLDFINNKYTLGDTTEYIGIDTANNTLIAGANLLSGSAGGASGQHLKININGTNYKIELRNP